MTTPRAIACALALSIAATTTVWAADKKKTVRKPAGKTETLACRLGTEDRHARIAVVVIKGKTDSFAYYSKWKPRTCSIYLQRNRDPYSKWADTGDVTTVNLEKGAFLIEHKPGEYHFIFRDIDRERYCGMDGVINGTLTIKRGKDQCILGGDIMVEGTPLGEVPAYARVETPPPAAGASDIPAAIAAPAPTAAPAAEQQSIAPAKAATADSRPDATAPAAATASAPATAAKPATASAPATAADPSTDSAPATAAKPATASAPAAAAAPAEQQAAPAEPAQQNTATAVPAQPQSSAATEQPKSAPVEKSAETASDNPLRTFFRALAPSTAEEQSPFP